MGPEQDNFEALRRMLALKRHEVPPPGFFHDLPGRVRAGIRADAAERARPWWQRLAARPGWRPALAGACALGGVVGVAWKAGLDPNARPPLAARLAEATAVGSGAPAATAPPALGFGLRLGEETPDVAGSVNPHLSSAPPPWLFRPGLRAPARATHEVPYSAPPGFRWGPGVVERFHYLPVEFETNTTGMP